MIIRHTNLEPTQRPVSTSARSSVADNTPLPRLGAAAPATPGTPKGDIIYGARAIARYLFEDDSDAARRRVYCLWAYYHARNERAGFFKLKGALCLSKSQWAEFHGLK